jgi:restriction system protein
VANDQESRSEWSAFYQTVNRLGPRLLRRVHPDLEEHIRFEANESDAFWSDGYDHAFRLWKEGSRNQAVEYALVTWVESVKRHLREFLGDYSLFPFERAGISEKRRRRLRASVEKITLPIAPDLLGLFIDSVYLLLNSGSGSPKLVVGGLLERYGSTSDGELVRAFSIPWRAIVDMLRKDWNVAAQISPRQWEELIAGAFDRAGYEEVTLTPASRDHGRDVIAVKRGVCCARIIGSVKAYRSDHLVGHDDVRALAGVLSGDPKATKGILTTTSGFAPGIAKDPFLSPLMPYRIELMDGKALQAWMEALALR